MDAIEIYNEPMEDEVLRVNLVYDSDGVKLVAVDQNGEPQKDGSICRITNDGKVFYYSGISEDLGLSLDEDGRIQSSYTEGSDMMKKLKIYNEPKEGDFLRLKLVYTSIGVDLVVVDKDGKRSPRGSILRISNQGKMHRYEGISVSHELFLDKHGRIQKE